VLTDGDLRCLYGAWVLFVSVVFPCWKSRESFFVDSQLRLGTAPKPQLLRLQLPCTSTPTRCQLSIVFTSFVNLLLSYMSRRLEHIVHHHHRRHHGWYLEQGATSWGGHIPDQPYLPST